MQDDDITTVVDEPALLHASYDRTEGTFYVRASIQVSLKGELYQPVASILTEHCHRVESTEVCRDPHMILREARETMYRLWHRCPGTSSDVQHGQQCIHGRQDGAEASIKIAS